jgi:large subunit ribosomal protein L5
MTLIKQHYNNIIKYDIINKYCFNNTFLIPKLTKITLSFNFKKYSKKNFIGCLILLEMLTGNSGYIIKSKKNNVVLKIKKGAPIGCMVVLKKKPLELFLEKFLYNYLPNIQNKNIIVKSKNFFSFLIPKTFLINEFNEFYLYFKDVPNLNLTFTANSKSTNELIFLINSLNIK